MVFASPIFLFLPLTLAAYALAPRRAKDAMLLVVSLAFYIGGEEPYVALVAASVLANWAFGVPRFDGEPVTSSANAPRERWLADAMPCISPKLNSIRE